MPKWVANEKIWEKAKRAYRKSYGSGPINYAILTDIYKNMGGKIKKSKKGGKKKRKR